MPIKPAPKALWDALDALPADRTVTQRVVKDRMPELRPGEQSGVRPLAELGAPLLRIGLGGESQQRTPRQAPTELDLGEVLGEGGMGMVCVANQRSLGREVAVKMLRPSANPLERRGSLLREGRITGQLEHPNVVPVHLIAEADDGGAPVVVMKRIHGESWDTLIGDPDHAFWPPSERTRRAQLARHLEILVQVCRAVEFAHSRGIVHRDIKPSNVMVGEFGEVYLADWGVALRLDERVSAGEDDTFRFEGTPSYMAPEMAAADESLVDERTDVYLLGATLFELLTRCKPNDASAGLSSAVHELLDRPCLDPAAYEDALHPELAALVRDATATEPAARMATAARFREALTEYLRHRDSLLATDLADEQAVALTALLDDESEDEAWRRGLLSRFAAVQLGYRAALDGWPNNRRARAGLEACTEQMLEHALATRDATFAEVLLAQLADPSERFRDRVDEIREARRSEREAHETLERMRADADFAGGKRVRNAIVGGMIALGCGFWALELAGVIEQSLETITAFALSVLTFSLGVYGVVSRRTRLSRINRTFFLLFATALASLCANRCLSLLEGTSLAVTLSRDMLIQGFVCGVSIFVLGRWMGVAAGIFVVGAVAASALPEHARPIYLVAQFAAPIFTVVWVTRHGDRISRTLGEH